MDKINYIKRIALEYTDKHYPNISCILLTGSQIDGDILTNHSDIDILLIDSCFSSISSEGMIKNNYKIDFTRVGLYNIIEILIEDLYVANPIFLNMLKGSSVIRDNLNLMAYFKNFINNIESNEIYDISNISQNSILKLAKLKKIS